MQRLSSCLLIHHHVSSFLLKLFSAEIMRPTELRSCSVYPANAPHRRPLLTDGQKTNWTKHKGARFDAFLWLHNSTVSRPRWLESLIWTQMTKQTSLSRSLTYSLLVRDVQLWFSVRLELVLFKSCIDPSILHDLLQKQSDTIRAQLIPDLQTSISASHTCVYVRKSVMFSGFSRVQTIQIYFSREHMTHNPSNLI